MSNLGLKTVLEIFLIGFNFENLSQQLVAEALELSLSGYGKIERNETDISVSKLEKIAKVLGTDVRSIHNFDDKNYINFIENKQAMFSMRDQHINTMEMFDKMVEQYKEEIAYLKSVIDKLMDKKQGTNIVNTILWLSQILIAKCRFHYD